MIQHEKHIFQLRQQPGKREHKVDRDWPRFDGCHLHKLSSTFNKHQFSFLPFVISHHLISPSRSPKEPIVVWSQSWENFKSSGKLGRTLLGGTPLQTSKDAFTNQISLYCSILSCLYCLFLFPASDKWTVPIPSFMSPMGSYLRDQPWRSPTCRTYNINIHFTSWKQII